MGVSPAAKAARAERRWPCSPPGCWPRGQLPGALVWLARMSLNRTVGPAELQPAVSPQSYIDVLTDGFMWKVAWHTLCSASW